MADSRWIAFELHDGLMQWILGARMHLSALTAEADQAKRSNETPNDLAEQLHQILACMNRAADEGRQLMRFIEDLGDEPVLNVIEVIQNNCSLLTRKTRGGTPCIEVQTPEDPWPQLSPPVAWAIVRIVHQALMNAILHAKSSQICVQFSQTAQHLKVAVVDDGVGFEVAKSIGSASGLGLRSMRQRSQALGLSLDIQSVPNEGTKVSVTVPFH